jgi:hypothetical protein
VVTRQAPLILLGMAVFFLVVMAMYFLKNSKPSRPRPIPESVSQLPVT